MSGVYASGAKAWPQDTYAGLQQDIAACEQRICHQLDRDPDHLVALAMFNADLRRAREKLHYLKVRAGRASMSVPSAEVEHA